jgi:hemerythrin-like metal-binding protein
VALVQWKEDYSVGVKQIDGQHQKWIEILHDLHEAMKVGKGREVIGEILERVKDYVQLHFATEERLLKNADYSDFDNHKRIHDSFVKQIAEIIEQHKSGNSFVTVKVGNMLNDWLVNHITRIDKQYTASLNGKGIR